MFPLPLATLLTREIGKQLGTFSTFQRHFQRAFFPPTRQQPTGCVASCVRQMSHHHLPGSLTVTRGCWPTRHPGGPLYFQRAPDFGIELCPLPPPPSPPRQGVPSARSWFTVLVAHSPCAGALPLHPGSVSETLWWDGDSDRARDGPLATILILNPTPMATGAAFGLFSGWRPVQAWQQGRQEGRVMLSSSLAGLCPKAATALGGLQSQSSRPKARCLTQPLRERCHIIGTWEILHWIRECFKAIHVARNS